MTTRRAFCHCGQLGLEVAGDPLAVSICNCLACQRRTGSAFGMQAGFKADQVQVIGRFDDYTRVSDEADRNEHATSLGETARLDPASRSRAVVGLGTTSLRGR